MAINLQESHPILALTAQHAPPQWRLWIAIIISLTAVIVFISLAKWHPFLSLFSSAIILALIAGSPLKHILPSFISGFGSTLANVGLLIGLGAITGIFLTDSGAAQRIVTAIVNRSTSRYLPWTVVGIAIIIGIPLFFEVGVVLLLPIVVLIAAQSHKPRMLLCIPALAGLSVLHGFIPPHPGPLAAINELHAPVGLTMILGLIAAVPTAVIAGPIFAYWIAPRIKFNQDIAGLSQQNSDKEKMNMIAGPPLWLSLCIVALPVVCILLGTLENHLKNNHSVLADYTRFIGQPIVALGITALVSVIVLTKYIPEGNASHQVHKGLAEVASIVFIVGAGGGLKQTIVDTHIDKLVAYDVQSINLSPFIAAWMLAVVIRLVTGSATVATVTTSGIASQLSAIPLSESHLALLVLAIGAGSLFFSHVSDAGFWLVRGYTGMTVRQTFATFSVMECIISVIGLGMVLLLSLIIT